MLAAKDSVRGRRREDSLAVLRWRSQVREVIKSGACVIMWSVCLVVYHQRISTNSDTNRLQLRPSPKAVQLF